jgi:hypothetical protein
MKRGGLFFIGLISAIATIISLNIAFGRSGFYYDRYPYYGRYHHCNERYDRNYDERSKQDHRLQRDSSTSNY